MINTKLLTTTLLVVCNLTTNAQTTNTSPLPAGETIIGNHLHVGADNEVWTDAAYLYFNYRGAASTTYFWNLEGSSGKPIMTLLNNGCVGVGTASPQSKLHILDGNNNIRFGDFGASTAGIELSDGAINSAESVYLLGWDNSFRVSIGNPNKGNHLFTILNSGNVGIGTTIPDQKLTVKGKIHAEEVIVDLNVPVADYVFKPTYRLMPLPEVEQFVKTNSHLPEIPSATEITKNGLSMGEMQNKLLQKVEELTLYAIQQNKSKKELEAKLAKQENQYNALLEKVEMLTKQMEKK